MKQGWEVKKLGELCNLITKGTTPTSIGYKFTDEGINFIKVESLTESGEIIPNKVAYINAECHQALKRSQLKTNDILFSIAGALGRIGIVRDEIIPANTNQALAIIRLKNNSGVLVNYLAKYFNSNFISDEIEKLQGGAAQQNLSLTQLNNLYIPFPSLPEQQRIVTILDEAFVAIERAKANAGQNLKNAKELFESYLNTVDADKVSLGSLVDIKTGKLNSNAAVDNGPYPFFTCSREIFAIDNYAFDLEAILLAGNNASGDFNVKHYNGKFNAYQRTYVITVNEKQNILYRYLYFQLLKSLKEFKDMSVGANTKFLKLGMIQGLQIALPPLSEQQIIVQKLDLLSAQTKRLEAIYQQKIDNLEELKKSILQKAFNGEL